LPSLPYFLSSRQRKSREGQPYKRKEELERKAEYRNCNRNLECRAPVKADSFWASRITLLARGSSAGSFNGGVVFHETIMLTKREPGKPLHAQALPFLFAPSSSTSATSA